MLPKLFLLELRPPALVLFDTEVQGREPLTMESHGKGFFLRLEETFKSVWPRPKMLIVNFPNNPTTATAGEEFYSKLVAFAKENQVLIVNDFSYLGVEFDDYKSFSLLSVPGATDVAIELFSLSKGFSLAGWRVGFALGNESAISALSRMKSYSDFGIFQPTQIAAARLLDSDEEILKASSEAYQERRDILTEGLSELGWKVVESKAGLFIWAQVPEQYRASGSLKLAENILEKAKVACLPGVGFDENSDQFLRFSLVERPERLKTAIQRLASCELSC